MSILSRFDEFKGSRPRLYHFYVTLVFIAAASVIFAVMMVNKKEVKKRRSRLPVPVVKTVKAVSASRRVILSGEGTVRPFRQISLVPQVSGKTVWISEALVDGGKFLESETLLEIESTDYRLTVKSAEARVKDLESKLQLTIEEAEAAKEEWALANNNNSSPPPLVAKQPQLAAARAGLAAGKADLERAHLNLDRTKIRAPFDGRISSKNVDLGQFVTPGIILGSMYSIEAAEIPVPMRVEDLFWFQVPGFTSDEGPGSSVIVHAVIAGKNLTWQGTIVRAEGFLDSRTRLINVIVRVETPYKTLPPLAMGLFVSVEIEGHELENAIVLPRTCVHEDDILWIINDESRLIFRKIDIARFENDDVWIKSGIDDGDLIITSYIKIVTDSMKVNLSSAKGKSRK